MAASSSQRGEGEFYQSALAAFVMFSFVVWSPSKDAASLILLDCRSCWWCRGRGEWKRIRLKIRIIKNWLNASEMDSRWHIFLLTEGWPGLIDVLEQQHLINIRSCWSPSSTLLRFSPSSLASSGTGWNGILGRQSSVFFPLTLRMKTFHSSRSDDVYSVVRYHISSCFRCLF